MLQWSHSGATSKQDRQQGGNEHAASGMQERATAVSDPTDALRRRLAEIDDLQHAAGLLVWDQQTMMPARGTEARADAIATVERISHELFIAGRTGELLDAARAGLDGADPDSDVVRLVEVTARRWEKARRVPAELAAEIAYAAAAGNEAWVAARRDSDFAAFAPFLERNVSLARDYVACFDAFECAYDALLDDYEPEMKSADVSRMFGELKAQLAPMLDELAERSVDDSPVHGSFPFGRQRELIARVLALMGYDAAGWRLDDTVHPFAAGIGAGDVRITTRFSEDYLPMSLYASIHECGHGLYEEGIAPALRRTPLSRGLSLGMHESQSRLWENMVGRGRPFCKVLAPPIASLFGGRLSTLDGDALFRAVNRVRPSLIRVEADEATYSLHVILRFELEQELIEDRLAIIDLPEAWNARVHDYLGLDVPNDRLGVLQDVHWSRGKIGYFPTYALGNLIAAQLWARAGADIDGLDAHLAAGELAPLRDWLREHVHRHGAKFSTAELLERVVGGPLAVEPFADYLRHKLSDVYGVTLSAPADVASPSQTSA
jgi:carboxypeptidase Taq